MENAARAIIMAAGVLIAVALLTFFSYLFRNIGESTGDIYSTMSESEISEFNQQFLNYDWNVTYTKTYDDTGALVYEGGKQLTVQDVATLINLAMDNNKTQRVPTEVTVIINSPSYRFNINSTDGYETWINANVSSDSTYKCEVTITNKLVSLVSLTKL